MTVRDASSPDEFADAASAVADDRVEWWDLFAPEAIAGHWPIVKAYVSSIEQFACELIPTHIPAGDIPVDKFRSMVVLKSLEAPVSGWVSHYGYGRGTAAFVVAVARATSSSTDAVIEPSGIRPDVWNIDITRYFRMSFNAFRQVSDPLDDIRESLGVSVRELGDIFGVSRQTMTTWMDEGVPTGRNQAVGDVSQVVSLLNRKLKPGRLPLIARRPAPAFGGRSLLDALADDPAGTAHVVDSLFDWSQTA